MVYFFCLNPSVRLAESIALIICRIPDNLEARCVFADHNITL